MAPAHPARVVTAPLVAGERVFVLAVDRVVHAFDALDGRLLWTYARPTDALTWPKSRRADRGARPGAGEYGRPTGGAVDGIRGTVNWDVPVGTPRGSTGWNSRPDPAPSPSPGRPGSAYGRSSARGLRRRGPKGCAGLDARNNAGLAAVAANATTVVGADASDRITAWSAASGDRNGRTGACSTAACRARWQSGPSPSCSATVKARCTSSTRQRRQSCNCAWPPATSPVVGTPALLDTTLLVATRRAALFLLATELEHRPPGPSFAGRASQRRQAPTLFNASRHP